MGPQTCPTLQLWIAEGLPLDWPDSLKTFVKVRYSRGSSANEVSSYINQVTQKGLLHSWDWDFQWRRFVRESQFSASFDDSDLNLSDDSDRWGSDSEEETLSEIIGDSSLLFRDTRALTSEENLLNSGSEALTAPQTPSPKRRRSPASKAGQMERLLQFQQRLVVEKGLPKTRIQTELDVTPGPDTVQHVKPANFRKNLLANFQELGSNTEAPCPTFPSMTPAGGNCVESKSDSVKCDSDYRKVVSSGHQNLSSLSHSRYESVHKDKITPHISSVQSLDYPECGKSRGLPVPESAVQSTDSPGNERVHVNSVQNPDFKEMRGRGWGL